MKKIIIIIHIFILTTLLFSDQIEDKLKKADQQKGITVYHVARPKDDADKRAFCSIGAPFGIQVLNGPGQDFGGSDTTTVPG